MTARRLLQWLIVIALALAIHLAAFIRLPTGAMGDAGAAGAASVSLQAMTPHLAAMVARVDLADDIETPDVVVARDVAAVEAASLPPPLVNRAAAEALATDMGPVAVSRRSQTLPQQETAFAAVRPDPAKPEPVAGPQAARVAALSGVAPAVQTPAEVALPQPAAEAVRAPEAVARSAQAAPLAGSERVAPSARPEEFVTAALAPVATPTARETPQRAAPAAERPLAQRSERAALAPGLERNGNEPPREVTPAADPPLVQKSERAALAPERSITPRQRPDRAPASTRPPRPTAAAETPPSAAPAPVLQATPQPAQAEQRAQGTGAGADAGSARSGAASISEAQRSSLMAQWGGQIRSRIERRKPRGALGRGTVTLRISVANDGRLVGLSVARSSGSAALDSAAVQSVQRAGRFPRAPRELSGGPHSFTLPVQFTR